MRNKNVSAKKKMKILFEALDDNKISEICQKYDISKDEIHRWKRKLFNSSDIVFQSEKDKSVENRELLKKAARISNLK